MNTKQLKDKILAMAMRGELVEQDPTDESAEILLEKIKEEKAKLIAEKKIKKEKPLVPIEADEIPYDLPQGWVWTRFGEVVINRDSERIPLSTTERSDLEKKYDYYGASGIIDKVDKYIFDKDLLLIGEDGANLVTRSKPLAFIATGKYWVNNHAHVLDAIDFSILKYLENYINSISLLQYVTGSAQPKLNQVNLNRIVVPLPPLAEQKRIVEKIETLFAEVDKLEESRENLDGLKEKLDKKLLDMAMRGELVKQDPTDEPAEILLEKIKEEKAKLIAEKKIKKEKPLAPIEEDDVPYDLPQGWVWTRLGDVSFVTKLAGFEYTKNIAPNLSLTFEENYIPIIKGKNIQNNLLIRDFEGFIPKEISEELHRSKLNKKAILLPYVGSIGSVAIYDGTFEAHLGSNVGKIELYMELLPEYLFYYIRSYEGYKQLTKDMKATAQPSISITAIKNMLIPLPPLAEQKRIVERLESVRKIVNESL